MTNPLLAFFAPWLISAGILGLHAVLPARTIEGYAIDGRGGVLMAIGLALSLGRPSEPAPWLYPLYYVLLLGLRERDDDRRCAAKYGELWERYRERVPWRIVPRLY